MESQLLKNGAAIFLKEDMQEEIEYVLTFRWNEKRDCDSYNYLQTHFFKTPESLNDFVIKNFDKITIPEKWKDVKGYDGVYKVSTHGRIRSYQRRSKGKILTPELSKFGYFRVELYDNGHTNKTERKTDGKYLKNNRIKRGLHILVAEAFCPNPDPENFDEVDHINRVRDDIPFWNLRWTDRLGNMDNRDFDRQKYETSEDVTAGLDIFS